MRIDTEGERIMKQLDAMRKIRRALNRRMKAYRETVEPLLLLQALQEKRIAAGMEGGGPMELSEKIEAEKSLYENEAAAPMKQYLALVESVAPAIVALSLKEAAFIMHYYGLGKSWAATTHALHTENRGDRSRAVMREALTHCGVPEWMIRGRVELFPASEKSGAASRPGVPGGDMGDRA